MRSLSILAFCIALLTVTGPAIALEMRRGAMAMAGMMTEGNWETAVGLEDGLSWTRPALLGGGVFAERQIGSPRFWLGAEALGLLHLDDGDSHLELAVPAVARYRALDPWVPVQGAAFGLGLSWASSIPELEVRRKGESAQLLVYWFAEIELGRPEWEYDPFLRLHHRSDAWGVMGVDTGSNGLLLGVRRAF